MNELPVVDKGAVDVTRDPYGLAKLRRAFEDSQNRTGMVVGLPKVTIDASHVAHALAYVDALRAALTDAQRDLRLAESARDYANDMLAKERAALTARDAALLQAQRDLQDCHMAFLNNIKSPAAHDRYAGIAERGIEAIGAALLEGEVERLMRKRGAWGTV